jgi:hypothetical protein
MVGGGSHIPRIGEVCYKHFEQVLDGGLQAYVDTHGHQLEES